MIRNLPNSAGYSDSKGIFAARKAVMHYTQQQGIKGVTLDDIYLGNGASELIVMATNALLDNGDELLLPSPDYPLWTAAASLSGGTPVHYRATRPMAGCPIWTTSAPRSRRAPRASWSSTPTTRPARCIRTNCCGASCIAREHGLVMLCRRGVRQGAVRRRSHTAMGSLSDRRAHADLQLAVQELPLLRLPRGLDGGLGRQEAARDYIEGLNMLANMRLCSNVPGQWAIQTALGGYQSINDLVKRRRAPAPPARPGLRADHRHSRCELRQAAGALYMFPRLDPRMYPIQDDQQFFLECCRRPR
jgi:alanine-synthesizing transaminase